MRRDANGVVVPAGHDPLPWNRSDHEDGWPADAKDNIIGFGNDTIDFIVHAANYHGRLADIVRRLAEWSESDLMGDVDAMIVDAAKLWDEMKGGA